jgi:hypothetical protein
MSKLKVLIFMAFCACIQKSWASYSTANAFNLTAGHKVLSFEKNSNIEWNDFCFDQKMGCARFQIVKKNLAKKKEFNFGFIKIVTDKLIRKDFKKYCSEVYEISKTADPKLKNFTNAPDSLISHCSWNGSKEITHFFWKDGLTIAVTTSEQYNFDKIMREAKLNEIR